MFSDKANCDTATAVILAFAETYKLSGSMIAGFDKVVCTATTAKVCGTFYSKEKGAEFAADLTDLGSTAVDSVFGVGSSCPLSLVGHSISMYSTNSACVDVQAEGSACAEPSTPFPFCVCQKEKYVTPFQVGLTVSSTVGPKSTTYCLAVKADTPLEPTSKCGKATTLKKAEFWFNYSMRFKVASLSVKYNDGKVVTRSPTWAPADENTMKINNLMWTPAVVKAKAPQLCIELKEGTTLEEFSADPNGLIWTSLFEPAQNCCPTYASAVV